MAPERLHVVAFHNIIQTTLGTDMKKVGDYLETESETIERFALLPKRMSNDKLVWFKKYIELRHYVNLLGHPFLRENWYSAFFTPEDYTVFLLKNETFNPDIATEFTGNPRIHKQKSILARWKQNFNLDKDEA